MPSKAGVVPSFTRATLRPDHHKSPVEANNEAVSRAAGNEVFGLIKNRKEEPSKRRKYPCLFPLSLSLDNDNIVVRANFTLFIFLGVLRRRGKECSRWSAREWRHLSSDGCCLRPSDNKIPTITSSLGGWVFWFFTSLSPLQNSNYIRKP